MMDIEKKLQQCCNAAAATWRENTIKIYEQTKEEIIAYVRNLETEVERLHVVEKQYENQVMAQHERIKELENLLVGCCLQCGRKLTLVRPGKWQCDNCG